MGDGSQAPVSSTQISHGPHCPCNVCKEAFGRRGSGSRALSRTELASTTYLVDQIEGFQLLVYLLLRDRGGAAIFSPEDIDSAKDEMKNGYQIFSIQQSPPTSDYVIRIEKQA